MANDEKQPMFDHRLRERFYSQRVLVLDGVLDDDNGTVLATQLLALASEDPRKDIALWIHSPGGSEPTPDYARHYAASWADPDFARPGGESLNQLTERAVSILRSFTGTVVIGSHGTFVARALAGLGVPVDWPFSQAMPIPAIYRIADTGIAGPGINPSRR